ncbi:MAG: hypothetical protein NTY65_02760 [Planctomycetota bacterium]|nr:hypothetical protein [Planctomycetota bacterium]
MLADLSKLVTRNRYVRIDAVEDLPQSLQPYAFGRFKSMIVAASDVVCASSYTGPKYTPTGTIYLVRNLRYCEHDGSPHFNADDIAFWTDCTGRQWKASSKDAPDHYKAAVAGTAVSDVWPKYRIPVASSGVVDDFRRNGGYLSFAQACPWISNKTRHEEQL